MEDFSMASTSEEINEVFQQEINEKSKLVENKFGILAFYENGRGMRTFKLYDTDPCWTELKERNTCRKR
jgi:hypothetical protein